MNNRLSEIIKYKTGGRQVDFAKLLGWTAPYLAKLLRGENFGLQPVLAILNALPEINARWFLFGQGEMLEMGKLYNLQREAFNHAQAILGLERFIPVMSPDDVRQFELCIAEGKLPQFSPDTVAEWERRLAARNEELNAKINAAQAKSKELCRQRTAK